MTPRLIMLAAAFAFAPLAGAQAGWQAAERIENYSVSGTTGIELYRSIGARGPKVGMGRAIAYTTFKLTWSRDYRPEGGGCRLAAARPNLTVIYTLPKPAGSMPAATRKLWERFIAGIAAHERVHGQFIVGMTKAMEAATVGLTVAGDKGCKKIRTEVARLAMALSVEQRRKGGDFDRVEMSKGGNVHQLILALVNGR
jgi:predicted secreted Zn-dependent protease